MWIWLQVTSTGPPGAAHAAVIVLTSIIEEIFANTNLPVPPGAPLCGDQVECQVTVPMCVVLSSRWTPKMSGKYGVMARSPSPTALGLKEKDQSCHHEVWMHLAHANPGSDRTAKYKHAWQLHLKERASPYDHNTQRRRTHREQSDHSRNTQVIHMTRTCFHEHRMKGPHSNRHNKACIQ